MKYIFLLFAILFPIEVTYSGFVQQEAADHWWCSGCGLTYPASHRVCLNKNCPKFRQSR